MDSTSTVGSSQESAGGRKPMKSEEDQIDTGSAEITVKRPDKTTTIPDVCYCGSCKTLYLSRREILGHFCSDHAGGKKEAASRKGKITELTEDCNLEEFLNWFLPHVLVDEDSKYFCDELFHNICEEKLLGAPMNCYFGGFILWVLTETWGKDIDCQKGFLRKLFISPRPEIDWKWYLELTPLSRYEYVHIPPTICIYDVKKKVEDDDVDSEEEDDGDENNVDDDDFEDAGGDDDDDDYERELLSYRQRVMSYDTDAVDDGSCAEIIRDLSKPRISVQKALKILYSDHKFSVDDARMFLDKFPESDTYLLGHGIIRHKYYNVQQIWDKFRPKPDTECWDPYDSNTFIHFEDRQIMFYPDHDRYYYIRGRPLVGNPVYELYSIVIDKLSSSRDFSLIYMRGEAAGKLPLIIYKLPEGKKVDLREPLPLKGPFRLPTPDQMFGISFTNSNAMKDCWWFGHCGITFGRDQMFDRAVHDVVVTKRSKDDRNSSAATIRYRISLSASRAELAFTIFEEGGHNIFITNGTITATDAADRRTQRIIQQYSKKEEPVCLRSGERLKVNRSVFGVPIGSYLRVKVKLAYFVDGFPEKKKKKIAGYLDFKVPTHVSTQGLILPASDGSSTFLCVEAFWTDEEDSED